MKGKSRKVSEFFHLLEGQETDLPLPVKNTIDFFARNKLWFNLSRNLEARSCRDAAKKRNRLGHTGIPLDHELKSFFGRFINAGGKEQYVIIHCKGSQELDFEKVNKVLNAQSPVRRLTHEELSGIFESDYGLVNPFNLDPLFLGTPLLQLFDLSLKQIPTLPYTMMTNAGDVTWAIEFKPDQLINAVLNSILADIVRNGESGKSETPQFQPRIGIITGNAPESGMLLWSKINQIIRDKSASDFYGDISFPYVIIESIPDMGLSMELDIREQETWDALKAGITSICQRGVTILAIACNTTQYFSPQIRKITAESKTRFISIPDATLDFLKKHKIKEFAFLGVKYVTELDKKWSAFKGLRKFKIETLSEESIKQIHELAFRVKQEGITGSGINKLRDLLDISTISKNIVIALTELSILMENQKRKSRKGRNYIDTLDVLAEAVADEYLNAVQIR